MSFRSLFFTLVTMLFFASCNKELSYENGILPPVSGSSSGTAIYSFAGGNGSCKDAVIKGSYTSGIALTASNTMALQVNVSVTGSYILSTSSVNGILFKASGSFTTTGLNTIVLTGNGTPSAPGSVSFTVGSNGCTTDLTITSATAVVAAFSLGGAPAACTGFTVAGTYNKGTALTAGNTVSFNVNVTTIGTYTISTNTVNGIVFAKSGNFTATGSQIVTLSGSGIPAAAGDFDYIVSSGASSCTFTITTIAALAPAAGTINCAGITAAGVYTKGIALTTTNTISIPVNITTAGTYSILTAIVNGCSFSGSGVLAAGARVIVLTGSGTPAASGINAYTIVLGAVSCSISINYLAVAVPPSGNFFRCKIDGTLTNYNTSLIAYNVAPPSAGIPYSLSVQGVNSDVANSKESLWVTVDNPTTVTTGIYNNLTFSSNVNDRACQIGLYPTGFPGLYWGSSALNANSFSVNVTSYTAHSAAGTFSGTLYESNGLGPKTKDITEGEFKISY